MKTRIARLLLMLFVCVLPAVPVSADGIVMSGDLRFQLTVPEGWENMSDTLTAGRADRAFLIRCGNIEDAAYLVFGCEAKNPDKLASFEEYHEFLVQGVTENELFTDVEISIPLSVTLRGTGLRGKMTSFTALFTENGTEIPVSCRLYALEGVNEYYQFFSWTKEENAAVQNLVTDRIVNSLRILI